MSYKIFCCIISQFITKNTAQNNFKLKYAFKINPIRKFSLSSILYDIPSNGEKITVHYITKKGEKITVYGNEGDNLMHLAQKHDIEIEGACEASLACCTCHVYVRDDYFEKLPEPSEEEEDLLDMAPFLKANSRLSCQIILNKKLQDIEVTLPQATRNFYVDDKKPSHH